MRSTNREGGMLAQRLGMYLAVGGALLPTLQFLLVREVDLLVAGMSLVVGGVITHAIGKDLSTIHNKLDKR